MMVTNRSRRTNEQIELSRQAKENPRLAEAQEAGIPLDTRELFPGWLKLQKSIGQTVWFFIRTNYWKINYEIDNKASYLTFQQSLAWGLMEAVY
jgi:hypothetical protein